MGCCPQWMPRRAPIGGSQGGTALCMPSRHRAASPAQPGRPHRVAREVRATRRLRAPEQQAQRDDGRQHPTRPRGVMIAPREIQRYEGERCNGMPRRKAVPRPAFVQAGDPMLHMGRVHPIGARSQGATGAAVALEGRHQQQAPDGHTEPIQALRTRRAAGRGPRSIKRKRRQSQPRQQPSAVAQYTAGPAGAAPQEAAAATIQTRHSNVRAACPPRRGSARALPASRPHRA